MEPIRLKSLIQQLNLKVKKGKDLFITGLSSDSRTTAPGDLFIAKKQGTAFIGQAIEAGAKAIVTDLFDPFLNVPQIIHPDPAEIEPRLAAHFYHHPSKQLYVVGVTGSKGKTTSCYLIWHLLNHIGLSAGLIGTIETITPKRRSLSTLTTHDAITNQKLLREMADGKTQAAVIEVSSHGLAQGRVDSIDFDAAVFTNLYPDHLDYHQTVENYAAAKKRLFDKAPLHILNADSPWHSYMGQGTTYGEQGEIRAENIQLSMNGTSFIVQGTPFHIPLLGRFNVANALAAISLGLHLKAPLHTISEGLKTFGSVPARLERIGNVFIDFAHTGEALAHALDTLREVAKGKVIVVFGCGGDRDPQRRSNMAKAADARADISIVTTDNPRTEDPAAIVAQIVQGFQNKPLIELDRREAIKKALALQGPEDLVLIAGKGHERVQIFANKTVPFDDAAVVKEILHL